MKAYFTTVRCVLLKDFRLLWPIILLCLALFIIPAVLSPNSVSLKQLVSMLTNLASALLMLSAVQTDAPASLTRDWLARPITPSALFAAKLLFLALTLLVPSFVSQTVQALRLDLPLGEALFAASTGLTMTLIVSTILITVAALTRTLIEATGVLLAASVLSVVVIAVPWGPARSFQGIVSTGSGWVAIYSLGLLVVAGSLPILWLQYIRRRTAVARSIFAGLVVLTLALPLTFTWNFVFSVQKAVAPGKAPDVAVEVTAKAHCAPTGLATDMTIKGLPEGWVPLFGRLRLEQAVEGGTATSMGPANPMEMFHAAGEMQQTVTYDWPGASAVTPSKLRMSLNLLLTDRTAIVPLDGRPHKLPGIGSCRSQQDRTGKASYLSCVIPGAQPAFVTARLDASDGQPVGSKGPSYAPAFLRDATDNQYTFLLLGSVGEAKSARLTLYEAGAHVDRLVTVAMPGTECSGGKPADSQ